MAVPTLPDATRTKLAKLLGMLGSDHQGERDNAAVAAHKLVRQAGMTWEDVLRAPVATKPLKTKRTKQRPEPRHEPRWTPAWEDEPTEASNVGAPKEPWRAVVATLYAEHRYQLNQWELKFVSGLLRFDRLSERQAMCLREIAERLLHIDIAL